MTRDEVTSATIPAPLGPAWPDQPMTWPQAVLLHLLPGVGLLLFFLATAPWLQAHGLPAIWALLVGILVVTAPIELGVVLWALRRSRITDRTALGFRVIRRADLVPLLLTALACLMAPGLVIWVEPLLSTTLLGWLPSWFSAGTGDLADFSPAVRTATLVLWLVSAVLVGPVVEELYFRGWLLPRLPAQKGWACLSSAALFATYHLWQPQAWLTVLVFAVPLTTLVMLRRNLTVSATVHVGVNLVAFLGLLSGTLQR